MVDPGPPIRRWLLFDGNRYAVAGSLLVGIFLSLVVLGHVGAITVEDPDAVRGVAGGLIPGLFTFLSIVLAINQLVLSQEFGSAAEIRERVRRIRDFRRDVEDEAGRAPSPVLPTAFLAVVTATIEARAAALAESLPADLDDDTRATAERFTSAVAEGARRATATLSRTESGRVHAILSVLDYPDSRHLQTARRLRDGHGDRLPEETRQALSALVEVLELFGVARTHFRTTYTQRVLARLSRLLLYVGIPALVAAFVLNLLRPSAAPELLARHRLAVVSALIAIALSPLSVLFAYILRIAAISERTIGVGPFLSRPDVMEPPETTEAPGVDRELLDEELGRADDAQRSPDGE